jgi:hypothetical protein
VTDERQNNPLTVAQFDRQMDGFKRDIKDIKESLEEIERRELPELKRRLEEKYVTSKEFDALSGRVEKLESQRNWVVGTILLLVLTALMASVGLKAA